MMNLKKSGRDNSQLSHLLCIASADDCFTHALVTKKNLRQQRMNPSSVSSLDSDEIDVADNKPSSFHSERRLIELLDKLFADHEEQPEQTSKKGNLHASPEQTHKEGNLPTTDQTDASFVAQIRDILLGEGVGGSGESIDSAGVAQINQAFARWEAGRQQSTKQREFETIQRFVLKEETRGKEQRRAASALQAREEVKMAADIARLKLFRQGEKAGRGDTDLQNKLSDTERGYLARKTVVVKAAQTANAECRSQLVRARTFFEELHRSRQASLRRSYERSLRLMDLKHRLHADTLDPRVPALERQLAERMYRKKEANLNELHMAQKLEESNYLDSMFELLDKVQLAKEQVSMCV